MAKVFIVSRIINVTCHWNSVLDQGLFPDKVEHLRGMRNVKSGKKIGMSVVQTVGSSLLSGIAEVGQRGQSTTRVKNLKYLMHSRAE